MAAQSITWDELVETIGKDNATTLCAKYGGVSKYIPADYTRGDLAQLIGTYAAIAMSARYGSSTLMLPNAIKKRRPIKPEILRMIKEGHSTRNIALMVGATEDWVKIVRRNNRASQRVKRLPIS